MARRKIVDETEEVVEDEESAPRKKKKKGKAVEAGADTEFASREAELADLITEINKITHVNKVSLSSENRVSSGLLCQNLILGGGIAPGMYTFYGPEQSAKTTGAITVLGASIAEKVDLRVLWDAENSTGSSTDYVSNIFETMNVKASVEQIFDGDQENGKLPLVIYRDDYEAEKVFNWIHALQKRLPDKRFEDDRWWYVYDETKANKEKVKEYDKRMSKAQGSGLWVPAQDGRLQAIILLDSYPSLVPSKQDEDEGDNSIAVQARMFSKQIPRIKGAMRAKRIALIGINQLRINPMARFGNPETEPGGQALKFFCMTGDTLMLTDKGMMTAQEVFDERKNLPKICGASGLESPTIFDQTGLSKTITLSTVNGSVVSGKPGHRVQILNQGSFTPRWATLEELHANSALKRYARVAIKVGANVFPKTSTPLRFLPTKQTSVSIKARIPKSITPDLAWAIGFMVGDGYVRDGHVSVVSASMDCLEKWKRVVKAEFGIDLPVEHKHQKGKTYTAGFYSAEVGEFLAFIGLGNRSSHTKEVPWAIRQGTRSVQAAFLAGHHDSDCFTTMSKKLFEQVNFMLLNFGIVATSFNGKDNYWNHGLENDSQSYVNRSRNTKGVVKSLTPAFRPNIYNPYLGKLEEVLKPHRVNAFRVDRMDKTLAKTADYDLNSKHSGKIGVLYETTSVYRGEATKAVELFQKLNRPRKFLRQDTVAFEDAAEMRKLVPSLKTSQEREKALKSLGLYEDLLSNSRAQGIVWVPIQSTSCMNTRQMTYDGNMPVTHTIVTGGIVSHNSDVRLRFFPRALSGVPFNPKGENNLEREPSVTGDGEDVYRYIHVSAVKNKLSIPGRQTWLRIWISDGEGLARGYCPVWDSFYYLSQTGQVSGKRSSMKLNVSGLGEATKSLTWMQFKTLILGTKEERAAICARIGYKAVDLRKGLFNQLKKGVGEQLYIANNKPSKKAKAAEDDDEDDNDE